MILNGWWLENILSASNLWNTSDFSQNNHRLEVVPHLNLPSDWHKMLCCRMMHKHVHLWWIICSYVFQNTGTPEYSKCIKFVKHLRFFRKTTTVPECMLYRQVNTDTNMYVHVRMYIYIYSFSFICMHVRDAHDIFIYIYIYIYHSYMQTLCYSLGRYLEHIYTYNYTTCRNILSARILWNICDLLQLGWLGSYSITSKVSNWNREWFIYI